MITRDCNEGDFVFPRAVPGFVYTSVLLFLEGLSIRRLVGWSGTSYFLMQQMKDFPHRNHWVKILCQLVKLHLYGKVCLSVRPSVDQSVRTFVN